MILQVILIAGASAFIGLLVIIIARRGLLTFRYTIGWLSLLFLAAFSGLFVQLSEPISRVMHVTPGVIVTAVGVIILVIICIQLSVSISGLQIQIRRLSEVSAIAPSQLHQREPRGRVLVIVPAFNEGQSVGTVTNQILEHGYDVLVIDDGSTDLTAQIATDAGACVIRMPFNSGVGGAIRAGLLFASSNGYKIVAQCDADGQHPVQFIDELVNAVETLNCDMVIGSRFINGRPERMTVSKHRRFAMWVLGRSASKAVGQRVTDVTSGFRVFKGDLITALAENMPTYYLGDTYETVVSAGRAGYRIREIAAPIGERLYGNSTANPLQAARLAARAFLTSFLHLHVRLPAPST
jgi:hypothetical protein